ncbi:unnamed protein product [Pocillopora meandrina]|uniref:Uncharacterized protein n=1 Tax=Pocillopora meandrina TaxID=46732 RepID=A0AAU9X7W3_9CNID|nr:unnamed protein product [Pocillopora meandrina]
MNAEPRDDTSSSSRAESSPSSKTVQTSIGDSENISDYENLEVTLAPKEMGKSIL